MDNADDKYFLDTLLERVAAGAECLNRLDKNIRNLIDSDFYMTELYVTGKDSGQAINSAKSRKQCVGEIIEDIDCVRSMMSFLFRIINIKKNSVDR